MIWCDRFVIGSIPRTGTDIITRLCMNVEGLQGIWHKNQHSKHDPLSRRWKEGMDGILTFRRLRSWFLSFIALAVNDGLYPFYGTKKMPWPSDTELFEEQFGILWLGELHGLLCGLADRYLDYMTNGGIIPVNHFLRSEHIVKDTVKLLRRYGLQFDEKAIHDKGNIYHPGKSPLLYIKDPLHYWSEDVLIRLEECNPRWMEIEYSIYLSNQLDD